MTEQEAIELLRFAYPKDRTKPITEECISMAVNALEKQIPKKPKRIGTMNMYSICPICSGTLLVYDFCPHCGQKIDWQNKQSEEITY